MNEKLKQSRDLVFRRQEELHRVLPVPLGETAAPGYHERCLVADPTRKELNEGYSQMLAKEYRAFAEAVQETLSGMAPFPQAPAIPRDRLWLWGGPTPEWGGSVQNDTLLTTARWLGAENGIYVYGPTSEEMIAMHAPLKKMLAMVTTTCRAPGQQSETDVECAEKLSRLSLKYPNVAGGMMDDMTAQCPDGSLPPEKVEHVRSVSQALKSHNSALELFGTVYCHELGKKDFSQIQPYLDGVALWYWYQEELLQLEENVELARQNFPGKKIYMGLFVHDYGTVDAGALPELLIHQLQGACHLFAQGKIDALIVLGDREFLKWPEQAGIVRGFLAKK